MKLVFSSAHLPLELSDDAKFKLWRDIYVGEIANLDISAATDRPFFAEMGGLVLGATLFSRVRGSITGVSRTRSHLATESDGDYCLLVNAGTASMNGTFRRSEVAIGSGAAALHTFAEPLTLVGGDTNTWTNLILPRALLYRSIENVDDLLGSQIDGNNEALQLLLAYCAMLESADLPIAGPVSGHVTDTIVDLVSLAIGAKEERRVLAGGRGLRAARLAAVVDKIEQRFAEPGLTAAAIASDLRLSVRYVQDLLHESGVSFSERVLSLRLARAFDMLVQRQFDYLRVGEIAYRAGFADISYFNRAFRRAYGCTPGSVRSLS